MFKSGPVGLDIMSSKSLGSLLLEVLPIYCILEEFLGLHSLDTNKTFYPTILIQMVKILSSVPCGEIISRSYWSKFILEQTSKVCKSCLRHEMLAHRVTDSTHTTNSILLAVSETRSLAGSMRCLALTSYGEQNSPRFSIYANSTFNFLQDYPQ